MVNSPLIDNFGRPITYLRLAVTDRCNLRCFYCMPEEGIKYLPKNHLLTYEEMERLVTIACQLGINKVRITGGEPFVRRDMIQFMEILSSIPGLEGLHITTNGVLTSPHIARLKKMKLASVNLSLDTLDSDNFLKITRRDEFEKVMETFNQLLDAQIPLKVNMVVMGEKNIQDIVPMARLTKELPVSIRYIEEMPFNGSSPHEASLPYDHAAILEALKSAFPDIQKIDDPANSTAYHYKIPGHVGTIGIIAAYTRTFCGSCNRIRVTAQGTLKTCLYDQGELDLKKLMRSDVSDEGIKTALIQAISRRHKDGWAAENTRDQLDSHESMSTIGG